MVRRYLLELSKPIFGGGQKAALKRVLKAVNGTSAHMSTLFTVCFKDL